MSTVKSILASAWRWVRHNRNLAGGLVLATAGSAYLFACEPKTQSIIEPTRLVTRSQFEAEAGQVEADVAAERIKLDSAIALFNARIDKINAATEGGVANLNRQDQIRATVVNAISGLIPNILSGKFDVASILGTVVGTYGILAGGGAVLDNRRKDRLLLLKKTT